MALIRCPECKKRFSNLAAACPSCGAPVSTALLADKQDQKHKKLGLLVVGVIIVIFAASSGDKPGAEKSKAPAAATTQIVRQDNPQASTEEARVPLRQPADSTAVPDDVSKYIGQVEREIASIPGIKTTNYTEDIESIKTAITIFGAWGLIYEQGESLPLDKAAQSKRQQFRSIVSKKQTEMLPAIRNAFGPLMRKQLWEADGSARTIGQGYRTVEFVSAAFASNSNIKKINEQMHDMLIMLRFTRAQYKWFAQAEEYTYYTLEAPKDSDVVKWDSRGGYKVLK